MKVRRSLAVAATAAVAVGVSALGPTPASAQETSGAAVEYVALGDSYSAGVGAGGYDSASGDCKRSAAAYPELWAEANAPASFDFTACFAARTTDVIDSQLGPLDADTTLVTLSVGGNDIGFADTMETCVLQGTSACLSAVAAADSAVTDTLPGRLDTVYDAIRAEAPAARVVVFGYPRLYELGGSCSTGLSEESRAALNDASDHLNDVTAQRAADHGFTYADVRPTFTGHEICSGDEWLHSVNWLSPSESYHPTAEGQSGGYYPVLADLV
ncbi:SGNH/GDSL hydrolase family protein [Streptomyces sp. NBC_01803]|uniref:SGNH/GDSL hydrolase family protein n=1 Tax=Streptomyces sp. NBC_01803 TaxID=2975946 RepID=UPI002DDBD8C8|nr:SGNH/GDSL hydrolase family protein [Streptomyces sp. NBC_01803]WSA42918.1 SGNH/GDSL hydrolase family protein [Streptomyces sp. NBC_01803]